MSRRQRRKTKEQIQYAQAIANERNLGRKVGPANPPCYLRPAISLKFKVVILNKQAKARPKPKPRQHQKPRSEHAKAYDAYLESPAWKALRWKVHKRAKGLCESCYNAKATQTHHITYARLFHELPEDLLAVCKACHQRFHSR